MNKAESLSQKFGATIAQTIGMRSGAQTETSNPTTASPDKYAGATRARAFAEMPVEAIERGPQPRETFDAEELSRLAESIRRFGQLAPIRVRHDANSGRWVVLVGERRLRACKLAGLDRIRVELVEREMTEADILAEQIVENAVRADLQPVEQARAYRRLMEANGWNAQELAEGLGIEPTSVYRALSLLKLPEDVAGRIDAGEIRPTAAYELSKLQNADEQRVVAERIVHEGLDHAATVAEVRRRKSAGAGTRKQSKMKGRGGGRGGPRSFKTTGGLIVTITRARGKAPIKGGEAFAALRDAVAQVETELSSTSIPSSTEAA